MNPTPDRSHSRLFVKGISKCLAGHRQKLGMGTSSCSQRRIETVQNVVDYLSKVPTTAVWVRRYEQPAQTQCADILSQYYA